MRLHKLRKGHTWFRKIQMTLVSKIFAFPVPDVIRTLFYRPGFFGNPYNGLTQSALRGPSPWTVAERELFAGWVSARNQCAF